MRWVWLILFLGGSSVAAPVQTQLTSYELYSDRYVAEIDASGEKQAIYDLSFPLLRNTILGAIGAGHFNLKDIIDFILSLMSDKEVKFDLQKIARTHGSRTDRLPDSWWKKIKWKDHALGMATLKSAPEQFSIADMDLEAMTSKPKKFRAALRKISRKLSDSLGIQSQNFFEQFEFQGGPDANKTGYTVIFKPGKKSRGLFRLIDLKNYLGAFQHGLRIYVLHQSIKSALRFIGTPFLGTLLGAVTDRWFQLYERMIRAHQDQFLELLNNAELGDSKSPLAALSAEERYRAGTYLASFTTSRMGILRRIFKNPKKLWREDLTRDIQSADKGDAYLRDNKYRVERYNDWFAHGAGGDDDDKAIFSLAKGHLFSDKPFKTLDYVDPDLEIYKRNLVEILEMVLRLIDIGSWANEIVAASLYFVAIQPIDDSMRWESRLSSYIRYRPINKGDVDWETAHLYKLRMNPFENTVEEEAELISKRRKKLGL